MQSRLAIPSSTTKLDDIASFRSAASASFVPLKIDSDQTHPFEAFMSVEEADGVTFTKVKASPQVVSRTEETIEEGGSGFYKVSLLLSGTGVLIQDGREIVMQPGDFSFYDTSRPYTLLFNEQFRNLIMMFPKDRLEFPTALTDSLTAVSLLEQHDLATVIAPFITNASAQLPRLHDAARTKLAHTSLDLLNTMLSAILDVEHTLRDPDEILLLKIHRYINANLHKPELCPGSIATANYISVRRLHSIFAKQGTTVSTVVRKRRLEHARSDLSDPAFTGQTVAAIAARWGFVDAAHFSKVFKQRFGFSPSETRLA